MNNYLKKFAFFSMIFLLLNFSLIYAIQYNLWGSQKEGSSFGGPTQSGNTVNLTNNAKIISVSQNADSFSVFRNGSLFVTVEKGQKFSGLLPPGEYTIRTSIGSVSILLDTEFSPEKITLWGRQTAVTSPRYEGNIVILCSPTQIVDSFYDGTDGMGIFRDGQGRAFMQFISPHNIHNPGPKVIDISGNNLGKSLVGQTLPAGVYTLTPGRGTADGIVYGYIVLNVGAGAGVLGWYPVSSGGNTVDIGINQICIESMENGTGFATQKRPYDFTQDYSVSFDFMLKTKDNHWFILYSDSFVHLHIDWGTALHYLRPANTKIMDMEVGIQYQIRIDAFPGNKSYDIYIDGRHAGTAKGINPGTIDVGSGLGTSGTDGMTGEWVYIGDDQATAYDRGKACWENIVISYDFTSPVKNDVIYRIFSEIPRQSSANFKSNVYDPVSITTSTWDKVPYHLTDQYEGTIAVEENQKVILAGDSEGKDSWYIDNFILFEINSPGINKRFIIGSVEPVEYNGIKVPQLEPSGFTFSPDSFDLTSEFPKGVPVDIRISALDYGGTGGVSDLYLIIK